MAATEKKYQLGTTENQEFLREVRNGRMLHGTPIATPMLLKA